MAELNCQFCGGDISDGGNGHKSGCPTGHAPRDTTMTITPQEVETVSDLMKRLRDRIDFLRTYAPPRNRGDLPLLNAALAEIERLQSRRAAQPADRAAIIEECGKALDRMQAQFRKGSSGAVILEAAAASIRSLNPSTPAGEKD